MPIQTAFTMVMFYSMVLLLPAAALALWRWPRAWALLLALYLGWLVSLMDLRSDDPQGTVLLLVTLGLFIGFARPAGAWRWACGCRWWALSRVRPG
jgi:hypothetical protein